MKAVVGVHIGERAIPVGEIHFTRERGKQHASFVYFDSWLNHPGRFAIEPSLRLGPGHQYPPAGSIFFDSITDSEPDGWGRMVIQRDRALRKAPAADSDLDFLLDVHDPSRIGALRYTIDGGRTFASDPGRGRRASPPLIELKDLMRASAAIERRTESARDLRLLLDRGSPPGGMRPKCTVLDEHGNLSIGKFASATDERDVVRGELLALRIARDAGIDAAHADLVVAVGKPVAVVRRFDRIGNKRLMYISAKTLIGAASPEDHHYLELADALRAEGGRPQADIEELWRRIVFSVLITNLDDHLNNHGFLHAPAGGHWELAPAFDMNPAPGKARVLKTWITEEGPEASIELAVTALKPMGISMERGVEILGKVVRSVTRWREGAKALGMKKRDIDSYEQAFEHAELPAAKALLARKAS